MNGNREAAATVIIHPILEFYMVMQMCIGVRFNENLHVIVYHQAHSELDIVRNMGRYYLKVTLPEACYLALM
jgi:hypothetical protein